MVRDVQPYGDQTYIAGNFVYVSGFSGYAVNRIARLNADGSLDTSFVSDSDWNSVIPLQPLAYATQGNLELHVSDGQHAVPEREFQDPTIYLNGAVLLEPNPSGQSFLGDSVPSQHYPDGEHNCGLWDRKGPAELGFEIPADTSSLRISSACPIDCSGEDLISLVLAILQVPPGQAVESDAYTRIPMPAAHQPIACNDAFVVSRGIGRKVLHVLGNDIAGGDTLLFVTSATPPQHGNVDVILERSAIFYTAEEGFAGSDSFTYTVSDLNGNTANATVQVQVIGPDPEVLVDDQTTFRELQLQPTAGRLSIRGGGQVADFYRFVGTAGDTIHLYVTGNPDENADPAFQAHLYLRDPLGNIVGSGNHVEEGPNSAVLDTVLKHSGTYTVEVTSHQAGEHGLYSIRLTRDYRVSFLVKIDGKVVPNDGSDLGVMNSGVPITKVITVENTGWTDIDLLQLLPGQLQGLSFIFSPAEARVVRMAQVQTFTCVITPSVVGPASGGVTVKGTDYLEGGSPHSDDQEIWFTGYVAAVGEEPTVAITTPKSGEGSLPGSTITFRAVAEAKPNNILEQVKFVAKYPGGTKHLPSPQFQPGDPPAEHSVTWTNVPEGVYTIVVEAYDDHGHVGFTNITLPVLPRGKNFQPVAEPDIFRIVMNGPAILLNVLTNDSDLNGDSLKIIKIDPGNGGAQIASSGAAIRYAPPQNAYGTEEFVYTISDGRGGEASALLRVEIVNSVIAITSPSGDLTLPVNTTINVSAATSEGAITKVACYVNDRLIGEKASPPYNFPWITNAPGFYTIKAFALDDKNTTIAAEPRTIGVSVAGAPSPTAIIANVPPDQLIREGLFPLRGTAKYPNSAQDFSYIVSVYHPDQATPLSSSTNFVPVENDVLTTLDFTTLRNGVYELELVVFNAGKSVTKRVGFVLESQVKIGQFTFSEQDAVIPASPVPITIVRTYDSFNPSSSDFGKSWSLAVNNMDIQLDEGREDTPIDPDIVNLGPDEVFSMRTGGGRNITLTLPDGRRTTFRFMFKEGASDGDVPCFCYEAVWVASPGVQATLVTKDNNQIQFLPWQNTIGPYWIAAGPETPLDNFDFSGYFLTNHDGTTFEIVADDLGEHDLSPDFDLSMLRMVHAYKDPKLRRIVGKDGSEIRIEHSSGFTAIDHYIDLASAQAEQPSRSVFIERDADHDNRITAIYDPASQPDWIPTVKYEYYPNGNLSKVRRLVDRGAQIYHDITYVYSDVPAYENFLTKIIDHRGVTVLSNAFENGRWVASIDAAGNVTKVEHGLGLRQETVRDSDGNATLHEYDARGNVTASINALGERTTRTYDNADNVLTETDALGSTMTYEYDGKGNRTLIRDPLEHQTLIQYNYLNQARRTVDARNYPTANNYADGEQGEDRTGNLLSTTNAAGQITRYSYDSRNRLDTITDPLLNTTKHTYYSSGEAGGRPGDLKSITITDFSSVPPRVLSVETFKHDANGNKEFDIQEGEDPLSEEDDRITKYQYDSQNRLTNTIQNPGPNQRVSHQSYNALGKVHEQFDPLDRRTRFFYDKRGNLVQTVHYPDANTQVTVTRTVYDSQGRVVYSQERCYTGIGNDLPETTTTAIATHNIYDALGRVVRTERLMGVSISAAYSGQNNEICETEFISAIGPEDPNDPEGPLLNPFISSTDTEFDAVGRVFRTVSQGVLTESGYDEAGRRIRSSVWNGRERIDSFYGYDENGNVRFFTNALGVVTESEYDELNRTTITHSDRFGVNRDFQSAVEYDALGRRIAEVNETDLDSPQQVVITRFGYDAFGRLVGVTNAYGTEQAVPTTYGYNRFGDLTSQTNAEDHVTRFSYNKFGQRIRRTLPDERYEEFFYDAVGNRIVHTNFTVSLNPLTIGRITEFKYDALNRLLKKYDHGDEDNPWVIFTYLASGQRDTMTDGAGVTDYEYYASGRLWKKMVPYLPQDQKLEYDYDGRGNLKKISSSSHVLEYTWDGMNRLESVFNQNQGTTRYTYDTLGNLKTVKSSNSQSPNSSVQTTYNYDSVNRLHTMQVVGGLTNDPQPLASYTYELGRTRKRKGVSEIINEAARTVAYTYDILDRLTVEEIAEGEASSTISYQAIETPEGNFQGYDKLGNRRSRKVSGGVPLPGIAEFQNQQFDVSDRLGTSSYDGNGNTAVETLPAPAVSPSAAFPDEYDFENRLVKRTGGNYIIELTYNGDGNRVKKKITEINFSPPVVKTITYLVDDLNPTGYAQVLREHMVSEGSTGIAATETALYCYGHDLLSQQRTAQTFFPPSFSVTTPWYGYDGHGSVRFLVGDDNTSITDAYHYDAFGILIASGGNSANDYLYAGEQFDRHLGLYYSRARYMNPNTGRFWSTDPAEGCCGQPMSQHKYLYVRADPVNRVDPTGLFDQVTETGVAALLQKVGPKVMTPRAAGVAPAPGPLGGYGNYNTQPAWSDPLVSTMANTTGAQAQNACIKLATSKPNQNQYFYTQASFNRATGAAAVLWHRQPGEEATVNPPGYLAAVAKGGVNSVHRGHLIPRSYGGKNGYENIVTQERNFNLGIFRQALEYDVEDKLAEGHAFVCVLVRPGYMGRAATGAADPGKPVPFGFVIGIVTAIDYQASGYAQPRIFGNLKDDSAPWNTWNTGVVPLNY